MALKPETFVVSKAGDPDALLHDYTVYIRRFDQFLKVTRNDSDHVAGANNLHVGCETCKSQMGLLRMVGGEAMEELIDYTVKVEEEEGYVQAKLKILNGIRGQTDK